ncbi:LexA family protein [Leucothrix mucor]|uniref:LexA family protein n=1 Tax=Leucothrix mucor TaxID=45248 RepID=UPI0003B3F1ED|nr:translesion error-prone DNA polymerase V autoproteolytic subunit [Leucothrix mucor]
MKTANSTPLSYQLITLQENPSLLAVPLYSSRISAGFASPADDHLETRLDLNQLLVPRPSATFMLKVEGDSMIGAGIYDGDLLIVDRSEAAVNGSIVIAVVHGELTVKRLQKDALGLRLMPENPKYKPIVIGENSDFLIWGCVTHAIHNF